MPLATQHILIQDTLIKIEEANRQSAPGALQSREPGDPELRVSTDAPETLPLIAEFPLPPIDDDIAWDSAIETESERSPLPVPADSGIDLMSNEPMDWNDHEPDDDSEAADSLIDEGPAIFPASDPAETTAVAAVIFERIGKAEVRRCVSNAFEAWMMNVCEAGAKLDTRASTTPMHAGDMMKFLHAQVIQNLRNKNIDSVAVWPEVVSWTRLLFNDLVTLTFES